MPRYLIILYKICICLCMFMFGLQASAQDTTGIKKLIGSIEKYQEQLPAEKLYLQFDRPFYGTGDTIWFKAYLLNAATYTAAKSSKVYVELLNDSNRVINRFAVPMFLGIGQGHIVLDEQVSDGCYTLRAYSNWMQNFGEDAFFNRQFYVGKPTVQGGWLVNEQHTIKSDAKNSQVNLALKLTDVARMAVPYRDIELRLTEGKRTVFKNNHITSDAGGINTNFHLDNDVDTRKLAIVITDKKTKNKYSFPFYPGGQLQNIDLQFMPEGGNLIAGLANKVAFKAIGENGLGVDVNGIITDNNNRQVSTFHALHKGIGSFLIVPQAGQSYKAKYSLGDVERSVALPPVKPSGTTLKIESVSRADSLSIYIRATDDVIAANKDFSLLAQSADGVYFGMTFNLHDGYKNIRLAKLKFMSGIVSFTLMQGQLPLNERKIFIDHHDRLRVEFTGDSAAYKPKDSISLALTVCDTSGKPVQGSFAVSVTDDGIVKNDAAVDNIVSRLLLTSELKGYVEDPSWYFAADTASNRARALDNLMLAQGWSAFNWAAFSKPQAKPTYIAETGNRLRGTLRNLFNKPVKPAKLNLFSLNKKHGLVVFDTVSNDAGEFAFDNLPLFDTIAYTLKVIDSKGNSSTATIKLQDFGPAAAPHANPYRPMPWYAHATDSLMLGYFNRPNQHGTEPLDLRDVKGNLLKEVKITAKKQALVNGEYMGFVRKEITEQQLVAAGKMSLVDLLKKTFPSFGLGQLYRSSLFGRVGMHDDPAYVFGSSLLADVYVDGQSASQIYNAAATGDPRSQTEFLRGFLSYMGADDVKNMKLAEGDIVFLMITTRSGKGLFSRPSPGIVFYRPVPLCLPRDFYRPKYAVNSITPVAPRPTLHWQPDLITDRAGKATLSFYAADKPGTYTVTIEGVDLTGNFGHQTGTIVISPKVIANKK